MANKDVGIEEFRDALRFALAQTEAGETSSSVKGTIKYDDKAAAKVDVSYKSPQES